MPQQRSFRLGWQSQNLARFILYKFSFLAEPVQVADDIGIDYFCTLFEVRQNESNSDLIPRNSFAIQVKSEGISNNVDLTGYLPYLKNLELPFFIGTVDRGTLTLTIYSGELLTPFFTYKGTPGHLVAELCERSIIGPDYSGWNKEDTPGSYILLFPKITEISASMDGSELEARVEEIQDKCSLMLDNIASSINNEFLLKGADRDHWLFFAKLESLQFFEINFFKRLSEAFYNLSWAYSSKVVPETLIEERFRLYENIYLQLATYFAEDQLPSLLREMYNETKNNIYSSSNS